MNRGRVIHRLPGQEMCIVQHDDGFALVELLGEEVDIGDILQGDWNSLGGETLHNVTSGQRMNVYMQGTWARPEYAIRAAGGM